MTASGPSRTELPQARARWARVNAQGLEGARRAPLEEKFDDLERLLECVDDFGWPAALDDDAQVRERWNQLRDGLAGVPISRAFSV